MQRTLILLKPSSIERGLVGEILSRLEKKGLLIVGMKMIRLSDELIEEHYSHLVSKPFFPILKEAMQKTPVIAMCVKGKEAVRLVREMVGPTNGRNATPGTIRGDYSISALKNLIHASDSLATAQIEIDRFFKPEELFDYKTVMSTALYAPDELN
ncbi:nucleoside-diphosphate kinase [Microbacter margulisiae]|uniref:Nucleoside diphosphate kinase n=1 Tax=Microbacter margulisiae TaxID=1350067 RepID=A0A7W5DSW9_9PORP|nr:nucleoside-diphosphate kinase [Microbacter margulisiae]MBB3188459.1 nucleoside-diphosphate kinase [Microbacter margulisiae]